VVLGGALLVVLPAALRAAGSSASFVVCWMTLWGATVLAAGPTAAALRWVLRRGGGAGPLLLGVLLAAAPLVVFAELLERATHHRPLGAVTFAVVAALVVLASVAVAARLLSLSRSAARARRWWQVAWIGLGALALVWTVKLVVSAAADPGVRNGLLDAVLVAALILAAARTRGPAALGGLSRWLGPLAWVAVAALGLILLRAVPEAAASVRSAGPVLTAFAGWIAAG